MYKQDNRLNEEINYLFSRYFFIFLLIIIIHIIFSSFVQNKFYI